MKKAPVSHLPIAFAFLFPILVIGQTPASGDQTQEQTSGAQTAGRPITDWRITEKEVKAVQAELTVRGYYKSKITGVLDRDTREAVRAYQADNGLKDSGRIDLETYRKLELPYPATGKEIDRLRGDDLTAKIGYGARDTTVNSGNAITSGVKKVGSGVRAGMEKTWGAGAATVSKSKEAVRGAGGASVRGVKSAGRTGARSLGRGDAEVHEGVRRSLEENPETKDWQSEVKNGTVTIKTPRNHNADVGAVVSNIRKIPGVKSVFVIAL
ncbi:MAG TPA: peptidoglycan-binding domain-containing protein [Blastocatellia bacterium]|nr:peptidoglycan-binding domain-containing protein [Blastocatellia bacterium]